MLYHALVMLTTDTGVGGTGKYRGAQVFSVSANSITIRMLAEAQMVRDRTVPRSFAPRAIFGDPIVAEVTGDAADTYTVVGLHDGTFGDVSGSNDSPLRGVFCPAQIPEHLHGQKRRVHWASGMLSEKRNW